MNIKIFVVAFIFLIGYSPSLLGQIEKGSWQVGLSGAPLFDTNASGLQGGLFTGSVDYSFSNRFAIGLMPYYGFTKNEVTYIYNTVLNQHVHYSEYSYKSFGLNLDFKFYMLNSVKIKPYISFISGIGKTRYNYFETDGLGDVRTDEKSDYNTFNLGLGLGSLFKISETMYIDVKVTYSSVADLSKPNPIKFVYPSIGIIKSF